MANVYKRGKTYWGRAQRDNKELRQSLKTGDKAIAEKRLRKWLDELEETNWGGIARIQFATAARAFMREYLPNIKLSSATRYGVSIQWLSEHFGEKFLNELGRKELSEFVAWRRGMGVSSPTIRRDLACLSSIFSFCDDEKEWIPEGSNPVPGFMRRMSKRGLKESPGRKRYLTPQEETLLLEHCTPAVREAVIVAIDTGLRNEEQFSLTWPQIDFARSVIHTTNDTKNGRSRTVPLPERSAQILAHRKRAGVKSFFVFCHEDGTRLLRQNKGLAGAVKRAIKANLSSTTPIRFDDDFRWHDLRRTAGCRWLQRDGKKMDEVSRLLGHSSVQITEQRYAFLDMENVASEIGRTNVGTKASGLDSKAQ